MVLAAGLGQRMRPITDTLPKPLVRIGGRTMLDHALGRLRDAGIPSAVVNVHHLADQIEARIEEHAAEIGEPAVTISDERDALLETGGGVKRALPLLGETFLAMNSDSLWTESGGSNLARLIEAWRPDEMDALLLLADRDSLGYDGAGDFRRDEAGRLARRGEDDTAPYVYAGVGIFRRGSFEETPDGAFSLNLIFDRAIAAGRLYGVVLDGEWLHVGTPEAIPQAEERLAGGEAASGLRPSSS
nr:nucleotidyltransferase family protein [Enterovirga rhinocerotis]